MKETANNGVLERLLLGAGVKNELGLAALLGISGQSVYNAKKKGKIPPAWGVVIAETFNVSSDWIFFGRGPMRPAHREAAPIPNIGHPAPCTRCAKLEIKLDSLEEERRELTTENRNLWKENSMLREENATLRERQRNGQTVLFDEKPPLPSSSDQPSRV